MNPRTHVKLRSNVGRLSSQDSHLPVRTNLTREQQLFSRLSRSKEHRELFVESEIDVGVPLQIRAMREHRGWTQKELADRSGKRQSVISQLEDTGYGKLTLTTLKTLASAFDVGLMVRFVAFSDLVRKAANLADDDLAVPDFENDSGFDPIILDTASWTSSDVGGWTTTFFVETTDHDLIMEQDTYGKGERTDDTSSHTA